MNKTLFLIGFTLILSFSLIHSQSTTAGTASSAGAWNYTCSKGEESNCVKIGPDYCCLYTYSKYNG